MQRIPLLLTVLLLAVTAQVAVSQGSSRKRLEGQLSFVDLHDGDEAWVIRGSQDGVLTPLGKGIKAPKKDKNGKKIEPGATLSLDCTLDATTGHCSSVADGDTTLLAAAAVPAAAGATIVQRLLVINIDYGSCGYPASLTDADLRTKYLGTAGDGSGGHALRFSQCSYGSFNIDAANFRVVTVRPSCTSTAISGCSYSWISNGADSAAYAALGSTTFSSYTHRTYILPPNMEGICRWAGLALVPGSQTWLQTSSYGVNRWATVMQESLHNYGLWHSWQGGVEYNDYSTSMGRGDTCPNSVEIFRMGWASAVASGGALDAAALPAGQAVTFNLPATYLTGSGNYLRVRPTWLSSYNTPSLATNLYLAVRVPKNSDSALGGGYANLVNIHKVNATMDNDYINYGWYATSDSRITYVGVVGSQSTLTLSSYNMVVYAGAWVGTDILRVSLCRYVSSSAECPALDALANRPPPSPFPPSPVPASPPPPPSPTPPPANPRPPSPSPPSPKPPSPPPPSPKPPSPPPPSPKPPSPSPPAAKPPSPRPPSPKPPSPRPPPPSPRPPSPPPPPPRPPPPPKKNGGGKKATSAPPLPPMPSVPKPPSRKSRPRKGRKGNRGMLE